MDKSCCSSTFCGDDSIGFSLSLGLPRGLPVLLGDFGRPFCLDFGRPRVAPDEGGGGDDGFNGCRSARGLILYELSRESCESCCWLSSSI